MVTAQCRRQPQHLDRLHGALAGADRGGDRGRVARPVGGIGSPLAIAAVIDPDTSAATRRGVRSIQPNAFSSSKPFHIP